MELKLDTAKGRAVAAGRTLLAWDQAQLARESGTSQATISNLERGRPVTLRTYKAVRNALMRSGVLINASVTAGILQAATSFEETISVEDTISEESE